MMVKTVYVQQADEPLWDWLVMVAEEDRRSVAFMVARAIEALRREREAAS